VRWLPALLAALLAAPAAHAAGAQGLCRADETCYFSCQIRGSAKLLSLCGKDLGEPRGSGYLQYRFGRRSRPELVFPGETEGSAAVFLFSDYMRAGVSRSEVRFVSAGAEYTVFDYFEDEARRSGVRVVTGASQRREVELDCSGKRRGRLAMLKDRLACDRESALGGDSCP
jgi:hypothetical protein